MLQLKPVKYLAKLPDRAVFGDHLLYTSCEDKIWICKTCDKSLTKASVPVQFKANNNLILQDVSSMLSKLNTIEIHLISLQFMKMVGLPCGSKELFTDQQSMSLQAYILFVSYCQGYHPRLNLFR